MRLAFAPLLLLLSACATMGASDPTAGLEDADITRRTLDGGDVVEE